MKNKFNLNIILGTSAACTAASALLLNPAPATAAFDFETNYPHCNIITAGANPVWHCCNEDYSTCEDSPVATLVPDVAVPPVFDAPDAPNTPGPTAAPPPLATECPTDAKNTGVGVNFSGLTANIAGRGVLTTLQKTPEYECGVDAAGKVRTCAYGTLGPISKHCVLTGYDPPPLLRPEVDIRLPTASNWSPFWKLPPAGRGATFVKDTMITMSGKCNNPFELDSTGAVVWKAEFDGGGQLISPITCPVFSPIAGAVGTGTITPPQPCLDGAGKQIMCPPNCTTNPADPKCSNPIVKDCASSTVVNRPSGCDTIPLNSFGGGSVTSCHNDLLDPPNPIPQYCPGKPDCPPAATGLIGGQCGVAYPLLIPIDYKTDLGTTPADPCPREDNCVNGIPNPSDGYLHLSYKAGGKYNISVKMGQNYLSSADSSRVVTLPPMGACKTFPYISSRKLALSNGYAYVVLPPSIDSGGVKCYGITCNYTATPTSWTAAEWPFFYDGIYSPYLSVKSTPNEVTAFTQVPFIDLPGTAEVLYSLKVASTIDLPLGGNATLNGGGYVQVPTGGWIQSMGDGSTVKLSNGTTFMIGGAMTGVTPATNGAVPNTVTAQPCYVHLIRTDTGDTAVSCKAANPGFTGTPQYKNPFVTIKTSRLLIEPNTELPIMSDRTNTCDPTLPNIHGSAVTAKLCTPPEVFNTQTQTCILPIARCDCTGLTNCYVEFQRVDNAGAVQATGDASLALNAADFATYSGMAGAAAEDFLFRHIQPLTVISGCKGVDAGGATVAAPLSCVPTTDMKYCAMAKSCTAISLCP